MSAAPLTEQYVREHFQLFCKHDYAAYFKRVSPSVQWKLMGTADISGDYHSLDEFNRAFNRVRARLDGNMTLTLVSCLVSGQEAAVQMVSDVGTVKQKNGKPFSNTHCWVVRYDDSGVIDRCSMYLDTLITQQLLDGNPGL